MKVLHVIPSLASIRGGPGEAVIELSQVQRKYGIFSEIVTTNDNGPGLLDVPLVSHTKYRGAGVRFFPQSRVGKSAAGVPAVAANDYGALRLDLADGPDRPGRQVG